MSVKSLSELDTMRGGAALRARLKHIDDRLIWFGFLRLTDHASKFGISDVQGKIDLQTYRNLSATPPPERKPGPSAAGGIRTGIYGRPDKFEPLFEGVGSLDDLASAWSHYPSHYRFLAFERMAVPCRWVDPDSVRALLAATELHESCRLNYQSMTSSETAERIVCPHTLVRASGRWHVRAFDFSRKRFIDFSLSRVLSSSSFVDQPAVPGALDDDWHATVDVEFVPHPRLSQAQRRAVAREFRMLNGQLVVSVRRALLFYLLDEMRLLSAIKKQNKDVADMPIWVKNARHMASELASMEMDS